MSDRWMIRTVAIICLLGDFFLFRSDTCFALPDYIFWTFAGGLVPEKLQEKDWEMLIRRIHAGKCTPFLGAGAAHGVLPTGSQIARDWAKEFGYPLEDAENLARVATYVAVKYKDAMYPKERLLDDLFKDKKSPDFKSSNEPHATLASLKLPVYMTTNYDPFMTQALEAIGRKPKKELCRWNKLIKDYPSILGKNSNFEPSPQEPVVFHLHGHNECVESLVLTEDDYLDFLVSISQDNELLPHQIRRSLTGTSLLFVGYKLADMDFRVLFRGLVNSYEQTLRRISVTVQLPPEPDLDEQKEAYLTEYFEQIDMRVYWGTAQDFMKDLRERWEDFQKANG